MTNSKATKEKSANYINHIALVIDASGSMSHLAETVVKVADKQIASLAELSKELDQETRVSVYTFSYHDEIKCIIFDKDVLRLPSLAGYYKTSGQTALIDATLKSQEDLDTTSQIYGDHAFLTFVLTDARDNNSRRSRRELADRFEKMRQQGNWTLAVLVPDHESMFIAKGLGFPAENIAIWDASSTRGMEEAGEAIIQATEKFMNDRASGVRSSTSIFTMDAATLNTASVKAIGLKALPLDSYQVFEVKYDASIRDFVESKGIKYYQGIAYYQLTKTESIQANKEIAVRNKKTGRYYTGPQARQLLGLPDGIGIRVKPEHNPSYEVFVQSNSVNRRLIAGPGIRLLVLSPKESMQAKLATSRGV